MQEGSTQPMVAASAPGTPAMRVPTKVAELTAIGAGGHLGNGDQIRKFGLGKPGMKLYYLILDQRHCRIAAAEAEGANLQKA